MLIEVNGEAIQVFTPAKLNLFLEVLGKRSDGYHEIESLMCPISLCDTLVLNSTAEPDLRLELELPEDSGVEDDPAWVIPADDRNLVVRAVKKVRERLNVSAGCRIRLKKQIPAAAGLGGGSSNAAAAVVAAMIAWRKWDRPLASQICAELGSDLNLFLGDENRIGFALATGRGEKCATLDMQPDLDFVVTHPPEGCATSAVYANYRNTGQLRSSGQIIDACRNGDLDQIGMSLYNALETSAKGVTPWIDKQLEFFRGFQFRYSAMTGSGSSCFALVSATYTMAIMRRAANVAGLSRVYAVKSWAQPSIEEQVNRIR